MPSAALLATIERSRKRIWGLCYRMTGSRTDADDLSQESIARALEREAQVRDADALDGWLLRIATSVCLDHLRRRRRERRPTELVDPLLDAAPVGPDPERALLLRDDVRFAVVVALQTLPGRQRAALVLHDVLDRPLAESGARARHECGCGEGPLDARAHRPCPRARAHRRRRAGRPAPSSTAGRRDRQPIGRRLHAPPRPRRVGRDRRRPDDASRLRGARGVAPLGRAARREPPGLAAAVRMLNGEATAVVTLPAADGMPLAAIHVETRGGRIVALRVVRDARKLEALWHS
jgi:RNA polymerase sigma factor (sigma-70 family)